MFGKGVNVQPAVKNLPVLLTEIQ